MRADNLLTLGYPELAVGDAYKARLLTEAALGDHESSLGQNVLLAHGMGYWSRDTEVMTIGRRGNFRADVRSSLRRLETNSWSVLVRGLMHMGCTADILSFRDIILERSILSSEDLQRLELMQEEKKGACRQVATKWEGGEDLDRSIETAGNGFVCVRAYPWMSADLLTRGQEIITRTAASLASISDTKCTWKRSNLQSGAETDNDMYGIFASKDIKTGDLIFTDHTITAVTTRVGSCPICFLDLDTHSLRKLPCCSTHFCSSSCETLALKHFHHISCGKDIILPGLATYKPTPHLSILLLQRFLSIIVQWAQQPQNLTTHLLLTPLIANLKPNYSGPAQPWTFNECILFPNTILQILGINIFTNLALDTWVTKTISDRIKNNATNGMGLEGEYITSLNEKHCLFNHSCHANVDWKFLTTADNTSSSAIEVRANRDIKAGEEMCDSYRAQVKFQARKERLECLESWFRGDCGCERCVAEAGGKEEAIVYWKGYLEGLNEEGRKEVEMMGRLCKMRGVGFLPEGVHIVV